MSVGRDSVAVVGDAWEQLASRLEAPPCLRPDWFAAWEEAFERPIDIFTVFEGDRLAGVLPVIRGRTGMRSPTSHDTPVFGPLSGSPSATAALAEAVLAASPHRIRLRYVDPADPFVATLADVARAGQHPISTAPIQVSPYVDTAQPWQQYRSGLSGKVLRELRRRRRRLEESERLELIVHDGASDFDALFADGMRLEDSGWKAEMGTALRAQPRWMRFYRDLAARAAGRGWLQLAFLYHGGRAIAFDLALEVDGIHYLLKTGYDREYLAYGPGALLRLLMIERAFTRDVRRYELLGSAVGAHNRWKMEWATGTHTRARFDVFPTGISGQTRRTALAMREAASDAAAQLGRRVLTPAGRRRAQRMIGRARRGWPW